MTIKYHTDLEQGSDLWHAVRTGLLTASEMKLILTPTLKIAANDKERAHMYELLAQRITGYVEPQYISDAMLRGIDDEITARDLYSRAYSEVIECGFITNDKWGFNIGYSPDGLVGDDGLIEVKSRAQRFQIETILAGTMPDDYLMQAQTGLMVSERQWLDFISFSAGLPMVTIRVYPDPHIQAKILEAATVFETKLSGMVNLYGDIKQRGDRLIPTERRIEEELVI